MRAAIYLRVSTDEQASSVDTQERGVRAWCERQGHVVVSVYRDVGHSGAEWLHRPAILDLQREAIRQPRPWDLVVVRDVDRLGRDAVRLPLLLVTLREHGVQVVESSTGRVVELDGYGQLIASVKACVAQIEREEIAHRVRTAHATQHAQGRVVGGVVYGYRNVRTTNGVVYEIEEEQAAIVRDIFTMHSEGKGVREIVLVLNRRNVPSPRAGRRGTGTWSPSVIWAMLHNERYRGVSVWGRTGHVYKGGTQVGIARPEDEWVTMEAPHLRIIEEDLWQRAQSDSAPARSPRKGRVPRYLLTGHARCAACGGPMQVSRKRHGKKDIAVYMCAWARDRGETVCTNTLRRPIEELDDAIVGWIQTNVLDEAVVREVLSATRRELEAREARPEDARTELEAELRQVQTEVERLADAITRTSTAPESLVSRLVEREARIKELRGQLKALANVGEKVGAWEKIEAEVRRRLTDLGSLIRGNLAGAREALAALLAGPLRCAEVLVDGARRYRITGEVMFPGLLEVVGSGGEGKIKQEASPEAMGQYVITDLPPASIALVS